MKRTGNLFDRIVRFANLWQAAHKAWRGKKDKTRIAHLCFALEVELLSLQEELQSGSRSPRPYRTFEVFEAKRRSIAAADFRDRVVHHAIMNLLEPAFERSLISRTFACRLGKGTHAAVRYAQDPGRRHAFFLKCDVQKYFESMDQSILKILLRRHLKDARLLTLLDRISVCSHQQCRIIRGKIKIDLCGMGSKNNRSMAKSKAPHSGKIDPLAILRCTPSIQWGCGMIRRPSEFIMLTA
ncbi:MAG: Retron-type reverse transcriptase [Magnetococcales bacterium]|nr:Retron-type reverse transcriptase [Magnetococcales bacterium]